jgi:hypothetical protein
MLSTVMFCRGEREEKQLILDRGDPGEECKMAKQNRRGFLKQASASVATVGVLAGVPGLTAVPALTAAVESLAPDAPATELSAATLSGPLLAHVSDLATGEITLLFGTQEVVYRDPELVMRLLKAVP